MIVERFQARDVLCFTAVHVGHANNISQIGQNGIGFGGRGSGAFPGIDDILGRYEPTVLELRIRAQVEGVNGATS